ncbi:large ribosomal subunit protein uL29m [Ascaphus truei]|uniref:large ribosomal subunit protein uL29m n=1 Tax=Ascaphus truei TaxID=8439 RepID=UPI003F59431B
MAASYVGRALSLCRHLSSGLRISGRVQPQVRLLCASPSLGLIGKTTPEKGPLQQCTFFHSSAVHRGLDEFFDDPKNRGEPSVKSGDAWGRKQLRGKSSEDLHKLWYVLLKEKNMLLTVEQEAKRQRVAMPSPERLEKVDKSLEKLHEVVTEREDALRVLQTGQEKPRPGDWRTDCFGETSWYRYKEWPIPWYMNRKYKKKTFFALPYVNHYVRLKTEKLMRIAARKRNAEKEKRLDLQKRFPRLTTTP